MFGVPDTRDEKGVGRYLQEKTRENPFVSTQLTTKVLLETILYFPLILLYLFDTYCIFIYLLVSCPKTNPLRGIFRVELSLIGEKLVRHRCTPFTDSIIWKLTGRVTLEFLVRADGIGSRAVYRQGKS